MNSNSSNKILNNKSLLFPKPDSLNSESRKPTTGPHYLINRDYARAVEQTYESMTFTLKMGDDIDPQDRPRVTIYKFTNPNVQDFVKWSKKLREIAGHNSWTPEHSLKTLNLLIEENLLLKISDRRTFDTRLDALGELIFTPNEYPMYLSLMKGAQRRNFENIATYISFIRECRIRADLCNKDDRLSEREVIDVVIRALTRREREILMNHEARTLAEIESTLKKASSMMNFYQIEETNHSPVKQTSTLQQTSTTGQ